MNWSISAHRTFQQCQRKWFYKVKAADARVKNCDERIEITRLANLITVDSWRGQLVDRIISEIFIKRLWRKEICSLDELITVAKKTFEKQFELATQTDVSGRFADIGWGFVELEYGQSITHEMKEKAWNEIEKSFRNLLDDKELLNELLKADLLLPQWTFQYRRGHINVKCIPDLVAFHRNKTPTIYDWKVNSMGTHSNENQLITYAIAVAKSKPQERYAEMVVALDAKDIKLVECQLLIGDHGIKRTFEVDSDDIQRIDTLISRSALQIYGVNGFEKYQKLKAGDFETTNYPENCKNCQFKKLCKTVD